MSAKETFKRVRFIDCEGDEKTLVGRTGLLIKGGDGRNYTEAGFDSDVLLDPHPDDANFRDFAFENCSFAYPGSERWPKALWAKRLVVEADSRSQLEFIGSEEIDIGSEEIDITAGPPMITHAPKKKFVYEPEIRNLTRKLIFLAHRSDDAHMAETTKIMERFRGLLETAVDDAPRIDTDAPPTVSEYFLSHLGVALEDESDPAHPNSPAHPDFTIETSCGEDCRIAIDTAAAMIDQVHATIGDRRLDLGAGIRVVDAIRSVAAAVVLCHVYG